MLRNDDRKQRLFDRVRLALQRAKPIAENVQVLRREGNEASFG
jgi:hypothetical protein